VCNVCEMARCDRRAFGLAAVLCFAFAPAAAQMITTDEDGDTEGYKCLSCPVESIKDWNGSLQHLPGLRLEAERFIMDYWTAVQNNDAELIGTLLFTPDGNLVRGGGPSMQGGFTKKGAFNVSADYAETPDPPGGYLAYFFSVFTASGVQFAGSGGLLDNLKVAIHEVLELAPNHYIIACMTNGTMYRTADGSVAVPWKAFKTVVAVRKFPIVGWKIVQFVCNDYNVDGEDKCSSVTTTGNAHVDYTVGGSYTVKHTDPVNTCSKKCLCGEAPSETIQEPHSSSADVYENIHYYVPNTVGESPGSVCTSCPTANSADYASKAPSGSPEKFVLQYLHTMSSGHGSAMDMYAPSAVIERNGGPTIVGAHPAGHGDLFFNSFWPGYTFIGTGGIFTDMQVSLHTIQRIGERAAVVETMTNGTLYNMTTGEVAVPWEAYKQVVVVQKSADDEKWKIAIITVMDYNTNGEDRCSLGTSAPINYCSPKCRCGEIVSAISQSDKTVYKAAYLSDNPAGVVLKQVRRNRLRSKRDEGDATAMLQGDFYDAEEFEEYEEEEVPSEGRNQEL